MQESFEKFFGAFRWYVGKIKVWQEHRTQCEKKQLRSFFKRRFSVWSFTHFVHFKLPFTPIESVVPLKVILLYENIFKGLVFIVQIVAWFLSICLVSTWVAWRSQCDAYEHWTFRIVPFQLYAELCILISDKTTQGQPALVHSEKWAVVCTKKWFTESFELLRIRLWKNRWKKRAAVFIPHKKQMRAKLHTFPQTVDEDCEHGLARLADPWARLVFRLIA